MQTSLRLLLLGTAFVAVIMAWVRVRQDAAGSQSQMLRNSDQNAEAITVSESASPPSRLILDASGTLSGAYLMGPAGIDAIRSDVQNSDHLKGVTLGSYAAVSAFDPKDFPNLAQIGFDDSFDLDFRHLSLEWMREMPKLEQVCFEARSSDPRIPLTTFSIDRPWKLAIWTDQVESFEAFPIPPSAKTLELHVPDTRDEAQIENRLKSQVNGTHVVVWNNFGPKANPL